MTPTELLCKYINKENGHKENGLQLKGEGEGDAYNGKNRTAGEGKDYAPYCEGGVYAVALSPQSAVEINGGEEERDEEGAENGGSVIFEYVYEPCHTPGENKVEENAEKLYEVKVGNVQIGKGGEEIEIGKVIIAHALRKSTKASALAVELDPAGEKIVIVSGAVIKYPAANGHSNYQKKGAYHYSFGSVCQPLTV